MKNKAIIAIPVRDEEKHIGSCLDAVQNQTVPADKILLLLNNCRDRTAKICLQAAAQNKTILVHEYELTGQDASAGEARRLALKTAAALSNDGIILTTDADAIPGPQWVEDNILEFDRGADVVCGMANIAPEDTALVPLQSRLDEAWEHYLAGLLDEIDALINPDPADPWPRHQQNSGASIALRTSALLKAGGAPHVSTGEDRALIDRLRLVDARIRHSPHLVVTVSGRLDGRAMGGMAETRLRRATQRDIFADDRIEPVEDAYRRAVLKRRLRSAWDHKQPDFSLAEDLQISRAVIRRAVASPYFGAAWAALERQASILQRRRVAFKERSHEVQKALWLRDYLHEGRAVPDWLCPGLEVNPVMPAGHDYAL